MSEVYKTSKVGKTMQRRMPVSSRSPDEKSETPVQSSEQTEPNTPTVFARCCQSVLAILPYLLFVHAVLLQSVWAGKTVHLRRWRVELKKRFWAAAVGAIFVISGISCLVMTTTPRSKSNSALIILYLVALFGTLLAAVNYVGTRPDLWRVGPLQRPFTLTRCDGALAKNLLLLAHTGIQAIQLITISITPHIHHEPAAALRVFLLHFSSFDTQLYTCVGITAFHCLLTGAFVAFNIQEHDAIAPLLYDVTSGFLYFPLSARLLHLIVWNNDSFKACGCMIMLMAYTATAVFSGIHRPSGNDSSVVSYSARYTVIERVLLTVVAAITALLDEEPIALRISCALVFFSLSLLMLLTPASCNSPPVSLLHSLLTCLSSFSLLASAGVLSRPSSSSPYWVIMTEGCCLITLVFIAGILTAQWYQRACGSHDNTAASADDTVAVATNPMASTPLPHQDIFTRH